MAVDRELALKTAEKLLRQGRLDGAIEQYVRLVEDQPKDWNSINALGDLYVRAGDPDRAVAQYVRIADFLYGEGFFPKAAALYKKALKVKADHEHTLLRLSDIAAQQGLLADAKLYLRQLAQQRRDRGDKRGAAECLVRLGTIDENDADAKVAAAQAAQALGDVGQAILLLQDAADVFEKQKRGDEALNALTQAAGMAPDDTALRARVGRALVAAGQVERAQEFLTAETAGDDPDLLLAVGRMSLDAGRLGEGLSTLMRVVAIAPDRHEAVAALAQDLLGKGRVDDAYACVEVIVDAALFEAAYERAAGVLDSFIAQRRFVPALIKLVDVCVDAGFHERVAAAQGQLADVYLEQGRAQEARVIAEDLVAREPLVDEHRARLRRVLDALGISDADALAGPVEPLFDEPLDFDDLGPRIQTPVAFEPEPVVDDPPAPPAVDRAASAPPPAADEFSFDLSDFQAPPSRPATPDAFEVDLSETLKDLNAMLPPRPAPAPAPPPPLAEPEGPPPSLDTVFEQLRVRATGDEQSTNAAALFDRAQDYLKRGMAVEAAADLQAAARVPQLRFKAAAQLGRLSVSRGDFKGGIEWLERAAEAPSPSPDETFGVLYDLADSLDRAGEGARALAVFIELEADAGEYRDVRERIGLLAR